MRYLAQRDRHLRARSEGKVSISYPPGLRFMFTLCLLIMVWCGVWMMPADPNPWKPCAAAGCWFSVGMIVCVLIKSCEKPWR